MGKMMRGWTGAHSRLGLIWARRFSFRMSSLRPLWAAEAEDCTLSEACALREGREGTGGRRETREEGANGERGCPTTRPEIEGIPDPPRCNPLGVNIISQTMKNDISMVMIEGNWIADEHRNRCENSNVIDRAGKKCTFKHSPPVTELSGTRLRSYLVSSVINNETLVW
jgi:hypothetical protein